MVSLRLKKKIALIKKIPFPITTEKWIMLQEQFEKFHTYDNIQSTVYKRQAEDQIAPM